MRGILVAVCMTGIHVAHAADAQSGDGVGADPGTRIVKIEEEIVVTAQRAGEQRLIETPMSVGVLQGEELAKSSARAIADVLSQVGGVTVTEIQPGQTDIVIRGVVSGGGITAEGGSNTTAYYIDEVPFGFTRFSQLADANVFDLERVEVLRGPQGTLYGANSLSGVVRVLTRDANLDRLELKGRMLTSTTHGGGGNYGGDVAVNVPLVPGRLAIRAVAGYSESSGFIHSAFDGQSHINDTQAQNYRLKVNWRPIENFNAKLSYMRSEIDNGAPTMSLDDLTTPFSADQDDKRVLDIFSLVAEYRWEHVSLLSSTGYVEYDADTRREILLSATDAINYRNLDRIKSSFSQELRLASNLDGPWQWNAGAFYKDVEQVRLQDARPNPFPTLQGVFIAGSKSKSYAVFGDVTREFNEGRFEVTAGLRYFRDEETLLDLGSFDPTAILVPNQTDDFDATTGRLVLAYKPRDRSMFYASIATGFRSGLQQSPEVVRQAPGFPAVDPDSLTTYELGMKGVLFGGALMYDTAVYYTDWEDIHQSLVLPVGFIARVNAGSASGPGFDMSLKYQPVEALALAASVSWNDLSIDEAVYSFDTASQTNVLLFPRGVRLNNSPEFSGSVGATFSAATRWTGTDFVISTNFAYGSKRVMRFLTAGALRATGSDDMKLLRATAGLAGDRWSLDVYADNLLDDDGAVTPPDTDAADTSIRLRPRTIGLQVTLNY